MKIGVITPAYNCSKYISDAIESVRKQTVDATVNHYIYNDCSIDDTVDVINKHRNQNTVVLHGDINRGQSHGRNVAIETALKDGCSYIAFLDADDQWDQDHLKLSVEQLQTADVTYCNPRHVFADGSIAIPTNIPVPNIFIAKHLAHNNFIWISTVVGHAECFVSNQFDSALNGIEDWDMWYRLSTDGYTFQKRDTTTATYLVHLSSGASSGYSKYQLFREKHSTLDKLRLHLGCGYEYDPAYINVDFYAPDDAKVDVRFDIQSIPYPDNSVDEIKAFHVIEHFHFFEIQKILSEWYRVLKPGGRLHLETPDFLELCRSFVNGSPEMEIESWRVMLYNHFFAHAWVPGQTHKFLFTESQMWTNLRWAGFTSAQRLRPTSKYATEQTQHLFLNVEAYK